MNNRIGFTNKKNIVMAEKLLSVIGYLSFVMKGE